MNHSEYRDDLHCKNSEAAKEEKPTMGGLSLLCQAEAKTPWRPPGSQDDPLILKLSILLIINFADLFLVTSG